MPMDVCVVPVVWICWEDPPTVEKGKTKCLETKCLRACIVSSFDCIRPYQVFDGTSDY